MGSSICWGQRADDPNIDENKFKYEPEYVHVAEKSLNAEQNLNNKVKMSSIFIILVVFISEINNA